MDHNTTDGRSRRAVLAAGGTAGLAGLAGCFGLLDDGDDGGEGALALSDFRGSGPLVSGRPVPDAPRMADLPDLEGSLTVYLGGGEGGLYQDLLGLLQREYPDFSVDPRPAPSAQLANTIIEESEGGSTPADVFWAVDAGALGVVADAGLTATLPADAIDLVPAPFRPGGDWVGVAGRARAVPYNSAQLSAGDIPDTVRAFPETSALSGAMGWAPTYGAFQSFVTAMRLLRGESATREWLEGMLDLGVTEYPDEFLVSNAVADGEIAAGFANHYYALRVQAAREGAPIELAFTENDAGALVNVSGVATLGSTDAEELATDFIRHLLSAEAQEFFATRTFGYPMVEGIPPVGGLPTIDELDPPDIELQELSDLQPTLDLLRDVGVL